jgi:drug/metabolite transporter (DMT)-like permease
MSPRARIAFAAVATLWGIPSLFIKVAVDDGVPPVFLASVRVALGAAVLLLVALPALRYDDDERLGGLLLGLAGVVGLVGIDATGSRRPRRRCVRPACTAIRRACISRCRAARPTPTRR